MRLDAVKQWRLADVYAGQWHRQRDSELHRRRQHGDDCAHGDPDDCRSDFHRESSGGVLHLHSFTGERLGGSDRG